MTYDAWVQLSEDGIINSNNVNFLVSDEGHRSISDLRLEKIGQAFSGVTVRLSFAATDRFDEEKSVEKSHHRKIFGKKIKASAEVGELAAYVQSQLYTIRVNPPEREDEEHARERFYGLRKEAWTKRMVAILRDGIDAHTGDPLSDAISGFYVADIDHARNTERQLNADPALARKATENGFDGVAVAIYSTMPDKEQSRRLDAFLNGNYMAVVGDEMLKEGLDYPPLKNIFDWQRNSPVDKEQIIGRALRRWWDSAKHRWAGTNIIDTVIYIGSRNPQQDVRRKIAALRGSVKAWDVLEDTIIYAPGENSRPAGMASEPSAPVPIEGQDVESAITLEQINLIKAAIDRYRRAAQRDTDLYAIDKEATRPIDRLNGERIRTNLGAVAIFQKIRQAAEKYGFSVPDGLTSTLIQAWFSGDTQSARSDHLEAVMTAYAADRGVINLLSIREEGISHVDQLIAHRKRTGLGARVILLKLRDAAVAKREEFPEELTETVINTWLSTKVTEARRNLFELVMEVYASQPTMLNLDEEDKAGQTPRQQLIGEKERTALGGKAIFPKVREEALASGQVIPEDFGEETILNWLRGTSQFASPSLFELVMRVYASQPSVLNLDTKDAEGLSPRDRLQAHKQRTGMGSAPVFAKLQEKAAQEGRTLPDGLADQLVLDRWFYGGMTFIAPDDFKLVMDVYAAQKGIIHVQEEDESGISPRDQLLDEKARTGLGPGKVFAHIQNLAALRGETLPEALKESTITRLLGGWQKTVDSDVFDYILAAYKSLPDSLPVDMQAKVKQSVKVTRTKESKTPDPT